MRRSFRGRILTTAAIALIALSVACRAPSPDGPPQDTIRAVLPDDPSTLCLIGKNDRYTEVIARQITDSLIQFGTDLGYTPRLAESWELSEDGKEITFHLHTGVRWHDGVPLTAHDIVFTVEKVREPETEARSYMSHFDNLLSIEAVDDLTVKAAYGKPYADFLEGWTVPIVPKHLVERDENILTGEFARHPVGCGPFRFESYTPGQRIVLEANDDYWDGRPKLDKLVFRIIPDQRTQYQSLVSGDVDILAVPPDIWKESKTDNRATHLERLVYHRFGVFYIAWNQAGNPFFGDARVRRAMVHAFDRDTFIEQVLDGLAIPGATTYHPDWAWTDQTVKPWPFDTSEADDLLVSAGWTDLDADGVREKNGKPFHFTMLLAQGSQEIADRMAAWIQQSLAEIGVSMDIEKLEWRAFLERRNDRRFEAAIGSLSFTPIPDQHELYHSSSRDAGFNFFGLNDSEVDRLIEQGRQTFDTTERMEIYHALQRRLHELEPITCLFHFASPVLHQPGLRGIEPSPIDYWRPYPGPRAWYREPVAGSKK